MLRAMWHSFFGTSIPVPENDPFRNGSEGDDPAVVADAAIGSSKTQRWSRG